MSTAPSPASKPRFSFKKIQLSSVKLASNLEVRPLGGFDISDLFTAFDSKTRPARVEEALWDSVFPPDRDLVRRIAGRYILRGITVEEAISRAVQKAEFESWKANPKTNFLMTEIARAFDSTFDLMEPPDRYVYDVALSVIKTADIHWRTILKCEVFQNPVRASFWYREWHSDKCLVCNEEVEANSIAIKGYSGQDCIHKSCQAKMALVGPVFGDMVLKMCLELKEKYIEPPGLEYDPDDADAFTWNMAEE
jgi:hypothetical protein